MSRESKVKVILFNELYPPPFVGVPMGYTGDYVVVSEGWWTPEEGTGQGDGPPDFVTVKTSRTKSEGLETLCTKIHRAFSM